jgi:hypothetical protein
LPPAVESVENWLRNHLEGQLTPSQISKVLDAMEEDTDLIAASISLDETEELLAQLLQ